MNPDAVARLLLDEAADALDGRVLVVDDSEGALTTTLADAGVDVRAWCDDVRDEASVPLRVRTPTPAPDDGWRPDVVLWRLPKALSALEDTAERLAAALPDEGRVLGGARVRHMTTTQNGVLARTFGTVSASLGRDKSRVLRASQPLRVPARWPRSQRLADLDLTVVARGAVFSTYRLDDGTRLLLDTLAGRGGESPGDGRRALDWGSGSGIIAAWLARRGWQTDASDVSADAVASTLATAEASGVRVTARRADGLEGAGTDLDLIVTNPPFHRGTEKDSTAALAMIRDARAHLLSGGRLWVVFNSHLPYLPALRRHVGRTDVVARNRHFTVTRSIAD